jgi:hypothetical protein
MKKILTFFGNKKFKHGGLSVLLTAVFITIIILVNIAAGLILERFDVTIDLTGERLFSIEQSTGDYLASLTDRITFTVMSREGEFAGINDHYNQTNEILKRFAAASGNITLRYIDIMSNPDFAAGYEGIDPRSVIVESQNTGRHRILGRQDYFHITYHDARDGSPLQITPDEYHRLVAAGMGGIVFEDVCAGAESAFLSAILSVSDVNPVHVGFITGHGEVINPQMRRLLELNAYIIHEINIVTDEINDEIDFIIINTPTSDYSLASLAKLDSWLDNGGLFGRNLVYISPDFAQTDNIDLFLFDWGIEVERAFVMQADPRYMVSVASTVIFYLDGHHYMNGLNPAFEIYSHFTRHVKLNSETRSIETRSLISSFDGAVLREFTDEWDIESAVPGVYDIAVQSSKFRFEDSGSFERISSNVLVFGSSSVFDEYFLSLQNANNAGFFMNMMNELSGKNEGITLTPKSFEVSAFSISERQSGIIGFTFAVILPAIVIITGIVIWVRRRFR